MPVFVSHSDKDEAIYSMLCLALDAEGIERWDVISMFPGASLADQLWCLLGTEASQPLAALCQVELDRLLR